jgi:hypothetical protein
MSLKVLLLLLVCRGNYRYNYLINHMIICNTVILTPLVGIQEKSTKFNKYDFINITFCWTELNV